MRILEDLFQKSKDGAIASAAVQSWTLLLSIAPDHVILPLFTRYACPNVSSALVSIQTCIFM
jgi:hypothetical protein